MIAPRGSARQLAVLRIVVCGLVLFAPELHRAAWLAGHPERLLTIPEGLGLIARLPLGYNAVWALQLVAISSAGLALLGWRARASLAVLTVAGGICFSFSSREGAVVHDMHLFWMTALLATSPCADAWSVQAWGEPVPEPSARYGVPLHVARLFLGLVYFFPGLHKLLVSGFAWTDAANVIAHMHGKWLQHGRVPFWRIDHHPSLVAFGACAAIAFELSFGVLALASRRTRLVALVLGLGFHLVTYVFFFIPFPSLWLCYVVLVDPRPGASKREPIPHATIAVGAVIALGAIVQGARGQTQGWPFACYPTFAHRAADATPDLVIEADGRRITGREHRVRSQAEWGRVYRLAGAYGDPPDEAGLAAYVRDVLAAEGSAAESYRVYRVAAPTAPERWDEVPAGGDLVLEVMARRAPTP